VIEFRVLGVVTLLGGDGRELRSVLAQSKRVALLAYLAAASPRRFHRRDSLLALFWPELDQEHARAALRQALHGLRRALGAAAIESRGDDEIGLAEAALWCDASAFDAAVDAGDHVAALALYRGDLLDGFFISGAPEFERWLEEARARLRRRVIDTAWAFAEVRRVAGDAALAAHWARHAAALVRDDEGSLRRLLALLGELGDVAGALHAYDAFARRLAAEYEATPAAETRALVAAIRSRKDAPLVDAPSPVPVVDDVPADVAQAADGRAAPPRPRHRLAVGLAVATTLAVVTVGATLLRGREPSSPGPLDPARVVVAALSNRTGDARLDALAEFAREEITRGLELTEVVALADPGAMTRDRTAPARRPLSAGDEAAAARALALATGSGIAVWGSMSRRGDSIEFAAQVVDQRRGTILRALEPVRGDALDPHGAILVLRDRIMAVVAEAVDPRLGAASSAGGDPPRYDAYTEFVTGVGIWYDARNGRDALPHFRRSAALDTTFALPLIWAAWIHQTFGQCDSTEAIVRRLASLPRSRLERLQVDRQMARCRGDLAAAYRAAHALVDARPGSEMWQEQLARDALNAARPREAVAILRRLRPERGALRGRVSYYNWLTNAHHLLGEHDRELDVARRARARFPGNLAALRMELMALAALGRGREVMERLGEIDVLPPDPIRNKATVMREIALDLAAHGDSASARAAIRRTLAWHASRPADERDAEALRFERALAYFAGGHEDSARTIAAQLVRAQPLAEDYVGLAGTLAAQRGDGAEAAAMDRRLATPARPYGRGRAAYWSACIAARQGRRDDAIDRLERALADGYVFNGLLFLGAHLEPGFAPLRGDPAFEALLRPKG
jgi:DNA-binding SARP family transcriptional activator